MGGAKNCPETPRQKMIGMMYLVLTAMLALNVSTDVLKAFKLVDDSLHSTLATTDSRNNAMMADFRAVRDDNPQKAGEWYDKAVELTQRSDSLYNYIQNFKYQIAVATDGAKKADPEARVIEGNDNRDATTHYALPDAGEKPGVTLKNMIIAYRDYLISVDPSKEEEFKIMFDTSDKVEKDGDIMSWEEQMFHDMPSGAAVTLMTKLQNDIRNAQSTMIQYLRGRTDAGDVRVNKLNAYVIPESRYVIRGGKYRAQIIMAAIDSTQTPEYYVEGTRLNEQGIYEAVASSVGTKKYSGYITYIDPSTGEPRNLSFDSEYSVGEPAVTIENKELNVMYSGHDNKFSISVPGVSNDKVKVSVAGAQVKQQGGIWIIKPGENSKEVTISVSAELDGRMQSMGNQKYRVKPMPTPSAYFKDASGKEYASSSKVPYARFAQGELVASYGPDGLLDVPWEIKSFAATIGGITYNSKSNKFTKEQLARMSKLDNGTIIMISEIDAIGEGGVKKRLQGIALVLN